MGLNWANNNHNYVPAFQVSGIPFVTGSATDTQLTTTPIEVKFPYVTRWLSVRNTGNDTLRIGFTENGINGPLGTEFNPGGYDVTGSNRNYFSLRPGNSMVSELPPVEIKCTSLWLRADAGTTGYELIAGYTNIPASGMLSLTGSNAFQGVG